MAFQEENSVFEEGEQDEELEGLDDGDSDAAPNDAEELARPGKKRKLGMGLAASAGAVENSEEAEASLLDLEVNGLLAEAGVDLQVEAAVLDLAKKVIQLLKTLPAVELGKTAAKGFLRDLGFVVTKPFTFRPPTKVHQVGSVPLGAAVRQAPCLDLAVELPQECFDSKDQLNHRQVKGRYHAKRALYLAHIMQALQSEPAVSKVVLGTLCNDPRKPVLLVHPPPGASPSGLIIRIIPTAPPALFPLPRLAPTRNNLRTATAPPPAAAAAGAAKPAGAATAAGAGSEPQAETGLPTPHYNTSILQDMLLLSQHKACQAAAGRAPHFAAAAALLRVWARTQALDSGADGVGGFLLTMLLADLVQKGAANPGMSAMHLFRTALVALSNLKTFAGGLFMQRSADGGIAPPPPDPKAWRRAFPVVFVDASGWLNLAAHVSKAALTQAQQCARASLELLNGGTPEAFEAVFLARRPLPTLCDYWYHVVVPEQLEGRDQQQQQQHRDVLAHDQPTWRSIEGRIEALASQALGSRARWVRVFRRELGAPASLKQGAPHPRQQHVLVGVQVDPTAALRAVDIGPPADQATAAKAFREFWGDRSELRRFQDGAICEAVVWECGPAERHLIPDRVVRYALQRHLPAGTTVAGFAGALDRALQRSKRVSPDFDVQAARLCEAATDRLSKQLRGLADVTLRVVSTQPLSAVSRHTAVFPPLPHLLAGAPHSALPPSPNPKAPAVPRCLDPVEIICQLEGSGRWPENVAAFLKMKAALGVQLAQALQASYGLEAQAAEGGYVDVLCEGFAFRLLLATERDAAMQQKALAMAQASRVDPSLDLPLRAWHQGAIASVAGANPAFEPTARLAQRWVGAHLLSPHLSPEAVELLVAHCFAAGSRAGRTAAKEGGAAAAVGASGSRTLGLLRFLRLLCDHPWRVAPLVVDPDREMSQQQREAAARQHSATRAAGTAPAMYISTPRDPTSLSWTHHRPSAAMLHRTVVLARRSADALERLLQGGCGGDPAGQPVPAPAAAAAAVHPGAKAKQQKKQRRQAQGGGDDRGAAAAGAAAGAASEAALAQLFGQDLGEFDALIHLRQEALPRAGRGAALPGLQQSKGPAAATAAPPAAAAAGNGPSAAAAGAGPVMVVRAAVDKHSRAILSGVPQSIVQARGAQAVRRELLVGFDPLPLFLEALEQRFGFLAVFCADYVGGSVIGVKWRASAFVPGPLKPEHAYALRALSLPAGAAELQQAGGAAGMKAPGSKSRDAAPAANGAAANGSSRGAAGSHPLVVRDTSPDVAAIVDDIIAMGAGLVAAVEVFREPVV
ncbi:hypothetical protein N2152v2_007639 [Parachlorella kessleri]